MMYKKTYIIILFFAMLCGGEAWSQSTSQVVFGKNRVQHHDFVWSEYESPHFMTYWYGTGRMTGQAVAEMAEMDYAEIQGLMEYRTNKKIHLIVYTDLTDLKQSNIGNEEVFVNVNNLTKTVGDKVFIYFNGDHRHLRRQIRAGIAATHLNAMMFGSNFQEIVQNAVLMNLPAWFTSGISSFVGEEWSVETDDRLRNALQSGQYENFTALAEADAELAGHAMWYFISQTYGKATISNLLYLTRINRSAEGGFLYVLGISYERVIESWLDFYQKRYAKDLASTTPPNAKATVGVKNKHRLPIPTAKLSPDGKYIAYVTNELGRCKVYLQEGKKGKRILIFKTGSRNPFQETDKNYPLLAWHPSSKQLAIIFEKRDVLKMRLYDLAERKLGKAEIIAPVYERLFSADFYGSQELVFSALVNGYSDLFLYRLATRQSQRLTNDFYDDLDASHAVINGRRGILFSSNRTSDLLAQMPLDSILPLDNFDIFFLQTEPEASALIRLTETPFSNEHAAQMIDSLRFVFINDQMGIKNRCVGEMEDYIAYFEKHFYLKNGEKIILHQDSSAQGLEQALIDSIQTIPVIKQRGKWFHNTNYPNNIVAHHTNPKAGKLLEITTENELPKLYVHSLDSVFFDTKHPLPTSFVKKNLRKIGAERRKEMKSSDVKTTKKVETVAPKETVLQPVYSKNTTKDTLKIPTNYLFQTRFKRQKDATKDSLISVVLTPKIDSLPTPQSNTLVDTVATTTAVVIGEAPLPPLEEVPAKPERHRFRSARVMTSRLKFNASKLSTQFDNSLLFGGLDSYAGNRFENGGEENAPQSQPIGLLLKGSVQDLFEDYQLEAGVRLPTNLNGAEYFAVFHDRRKQLDKHYAFYHRNRTRTLPEPPVGAPPRPAYTYKTRTATDLASVELRYPLDIFTSLRANFTFRNDKTHYYATDTYTLQQPIYNEQRLGAKLEYVFDNTMDISPNIKHGTRYKISAEVVKAVSIQFGETTRFDFNKGSMFVLGLDARHYERVLKHSIFATRLAANTSFGSEKILYFLGDIDNSLLSSFNQNIPLPQSDDFVYQTLATNLRGFKRNIRNGSSFILLNNEMRIPIFKYLYGNSRRMSRLLRDFQLVGFFDVGTAWQGKSPFSPSNPVNQGFVGETEEILVEVNYFRDPLVMGFGGGVRFTLFGYQLRLERAWGVETRLLQEPRWHFGMGFDF